MLTENGMGVEGEDKFRENGMIQDDYRIDFVKGHLRELHRAIEDGANPSFYCSVSFVTFYRIIIKQEKPLEASSESFIPMVF